ncbi:hypothetical protein C8R43DRAFT_951591 [Mycena crocata]|nr:hypothetical protein C8R43DRAFT_951591 [Mycena crocata]
MQLSLLVGLEAVYVVSQPTRQSRFGASQRSSGPASQTPLLKGLANLFPPASTLTQLLRFFVQCIERLVPIRTLCFSRNEAAEVQNLCLRQSFGNIRPTTTIWQSFDDHYFRVALIDHGGTTIPGLVRRESGLEHTTRKVKTTTNLSNLQIRCQLVFSLLVFPRGNHP